MSRLLQCGGSPIRDCLRTTLARTNTSSMYHHHVLLAVIHIFTDSSLTQALINNVLHNKCDISNLLSSTRVINYKITFVTCKVCFRLTTPATQLFFPPAVTPCSTSNISVSLSKVFFPSTVSSSKLSMCLILT